MEMIYMIHDPEKSPFTEIMSGKLKKKFIT
jgi:hypothetical protein